MTDYTCWGMRELIAELEERDAKQSRHMRSPINEIATAAAERIMQRYDENRTHNDDGEECDFEACGYTEIECLTFALEACIINDEIEIAVLGKN